MVPGEDPKFHGSLHGLQTLKIYTGYRLGGQVVDTTPPMVDQYADCEPVYEELPGWQASTVGITRLDALPPNARRYVNRIEEIVGVPVDMISTGPDRNENIIIRHPFDVPAEAG